MLASKHSRYQRLSDDDIMDLLLSLQEEIEYFIRYVQGYPTNLRYVICGLDLIDVIIRVDKRRHYFSVFHGGLDINDCKKAALFAYWLVKFRPIKITDRRYVNKVGYNTHVNELFAIHYLLSMLCKEKRVLLWDGSSGAHVTLEHPYIQKLRYSFRFRNFTIDSMIVLADTINTETFLEKPEAF
jgi:hypothetical protein